MQVFTLVILIVGLLRGTASLKQFPQVTYFSALYKVIKTLNYDQETCKAISNFVIY